MTQTPSRHFDLVVIGTGSGNSLIDESFADKSVAICEKGTFGGTCLNVGCIPTKMFVYAADTATSIRHSSAYGVDSTLDGVRWPDIVSRVFDRRIDPIASSGEDYRRNRCDNVTVFDGHATFVGPRTIDTGTGEIITADSVVIAAGARPSIPEIVTEAGVAYHTSDDVMRIAELPKSMVIQGSGFIACEFAHVFSALGVEVTVIGRSDVLLKHLDRELAERFTDAARGRWDVRLGQHVTSMTATGDDRRGVEITFEDGSTCAGDALLVATGRTPNGDLLGLDAAGVEMDGERVRVDEFGRTTAEGVWALGDVSSPFQLKHVANHEQRVLGHNLNHPENLQPFHHSHVPYAVFSWPQIASVGLTEAEARAAGYDVTVKTQDYGDVAYGWAMEDSVGCCKLIADRATGLLLGAHLMGAHAPSLVQILIQAMEFEITVPDLARKQYWIHPAMAEVVENALLGLDFPDRGF
ncbi:mycothione reductase [Dietzia kunjamensis]|jgi:mycothione reductase|uniref:mycothione reductase n=1 Tax=Dietzia TaxID=37914 RepID=UPI000BDEC596|nr:MULTISPECIES: mycothione reductase [Dietzia]MEB8324882.1 mycothione reductase [Dietzia kunjamensis]